MARSKSGVRRGCDWKGEVARKGTEAVCVVVCMVAGRLRTEAPCRTYGRKEPRTGHVVVRGRTRVQQRVNGTGGGRLGTAGGRRRTGRACLRGMRGLSCRGGGRSSGRPRRWPQEKMGLGCIVSQGFEIGRHVWASGPGAGNCPCHVLSCSHGESICRTLATALPSARRGDARGRLV